MIIKDDEEFMHKILQHNWGNKGTVSSGEEHEYFRGKIGLSVSHHERVRIIYKINFCNSKNSYSNR